MASRPARYLVRAGELALVALLSLLVPAAAVGWLYLARGSVSLPGPRLGDVLPLDELSSRAGVTVILYWSSGRLRR